MNYLAHLYFADPTPASRVGNLMGDFYRGAVADSLPEELRAGIIRHRQIDGYTDAHPRVIQARQRLQGPRRRFAGILVDLAFDHFLCRHWAQFHPQPLVLFLDEVYRDLGRYQGWVPERMVQPLERLIQGRWLAGYGELEGLATALSRVSQRFSRPNDLAAGAEDIRVHYRGLEQDFLAFFPDLQRFVREAAASASPLHRRP